MVGCAAGAAVFIAVSRVKNFFGLSVARGAHFARVMQALVTHSGNINPWVTLMAAATLLTNLMAHIVLPLLSLSAFSSDSIARAPVSRTVQRIDGVQSLVGQGLPNVVCAFFSGYPSIGCFICSGLNLAAGTRTANSGRIFGSHAGGDCSVCGTASGPSSASVRPHHTSKSFGLLARRRSPCRWR